MFEDLNLIKAQVVKMNALIFSFFYHDIIIKATKNDNEF